MKETTDTTVAVNGTAVPQAPAEGPAKFIREIDEYLGHTFDQMTQLDERFGKFSSFFLEQAGQVMGDRDYAKLSEGEQKLADVYIGAALAVEGACAVVKGIKETVALEKVKSLHRKIAKERQESLTRMIPRARRCHDEAAEVLARHNREPFQTGDLKMNFKDVADMLESELCQYRDIRFRLDMLLWLQDEYEAWMQDRLYSNTPIPTMGQSTVAAIYLLNGQQIPYSRDKREKDLMDFGLKLSDSMALDNTPNGKQFITAFELLAMIDLQLGAVLEHSCLDKNPIARALDPESDDYADADTDKLSCRHLYAHIYYQTGDGSFVNSVLSDNPLMDDSLSTWNAYCDMEDDYKHGMNRAIFVNGLLMVAVVLIPIWASLDWAWYWRLTLSVLAVLAVMMLFTRRTVRRITRNFVTKFEMMSINYEYYIAKMGGLIEPKSKVKDMAKSRNGFWWGLIIGGVIGLIGGPIGMIIGAIVGAIIGGGSSDDVDDHGEGWENIKICSPVKQWITAVILACVVGFEIYALFIK